MHPLLRPLLIVALAAFASCSNEETDDPGAATPPTPSYPFERTIVDAKGRKIDVTVVGRSQDHVIFVKTSSEKRHHYPLKSLSVNDQMFFSVLPIGEWEKVSNWGSLEFEHAQLVEKIRELENTSSRSTGSKRARANTQQIKKFTMKRDAISAQIREQNNR